MDLGPIVAAITAFLVAAGGLVAAWNTWGKQKGEGKRNHDTMTLDGVFRLVNELQEENDRCNTRVAAMEARIVVHEQAIARQAEVIEEFQTQLRELRAREQ